MIYVKIVDSVNDVSYSRSIIAYQGFYNGRIVSEEILEKSTRGVKGYKLTAFDGNIIYVLYKGVANKFLANIREYYSLNDNTLIS